MDITQIPLSVWLSALGAIVAVCGSLLARRAWKRHKLRCRERAEAMLQRIEDALKGEAERLQSILDLFAGYEEVPEQHQTAIKLARNIAQMAAEGLANKAALIKGLLPDDPIEAARTDPSWLLHEHGRAIRNIQAMHAQFFQQREQAKKKVAVALQDADKRMQNIQERYTVMVDRLRIAQPLPPWCTDVKAASDAVITEHLAVVLEHRKRIDALHENRPIEAAGIPLTAHVDACEQAVAHIERACREVVEDRKRVPASARQVAGLVDCALRTNRYLKAQGWWFLQPYERLGRLMAELAAMEARAAKPENDLRGLYDRAEAIRAAVADLPQKEAAAIAEDRKRGMFPLTIEHPFITLCTNQDVVVLNGRTYLLDGTEVYAGPSLASLDRLFLARNRSALREAARERHAEDLRMLSTESLTPTEQLVKFVLDEVFPHLGGGDVVAKGHMAGAADISKVITQYVATQEQEASRSGSAGSVIERATRGASLLIRKDGTLAKLFPAEQGWLIIEGVRHLVVPAGAAERSWQDVLREAQLWTCHTLRIELLREASRQGSAAIPAEVVLYKTVTQNGGYRRDGHRLAIEGESVKVYLSVPAFALQDLNGRYHEYPQMEVSMRLLWKNGLRTWGSPAMEADVIHPFAPGRGGICTNGNHPAGLPPGQYIAAYLMLARTVLRSGYRKGGPTPMRRLEELGQNIISRDEVARKGLPVTNANLHRDDIWHAPARDDYGY